MNFVYLTTNLENGKQYVGSHEGDINDDYLGSGILISKAVKKYKPNNFKREILEECLPENNLILEEKYINEYKTLIPDGYNISPTGGVRGGGKHSEETKRKIRNKLKGKISPQKGAKLSDETKEKLKFVQLGRTHSKETKKKISMSKKGQISPRKGVKLSEETKRKISESKRKNPVIVVNHTPEGLERIRQAMKTRIVSEETKKKMSESLKGREVWNKGITHSDETKKKMSEKRKGTMKGKDNPMYGKSPYDIWIEKYGKEEADKRKKALYEKRSKNRKTKES